MKKILTLMACMFMCLAISAKKPVVVDIQDASEMASRIEVVNDSTIIYYHVYGIQVAQPDGVYTGIFKYNPTKKKPMELMTMNKGAYIWQDKDQVLGTYILYASRAFDRVVLRAKEE